MSRAIAVFCSSSTEIPDRYLRLATEVGAAIAKRGWTLVSGGECVSMMGAVAQAVRAGGAHTVGIVSSALLDKVDGKVGELAITESLSERKFRILARSAALLVLPGGIGTCDELFEMWALRMIGVHEKPIVLLDLDGFYSGLIAWVADAAKLGFIRPSSLANLTVTHTVSAALEACAGCPGPEASPKRIAITDRATGGAR